MGTTTTPPRREDQSPAGRPPEDDDGEDRAEGPDVQLIVRRSAAIVVGGLCLAVSLLGVGMAVILMTATGSLAQKVFGEDEPTVVVETIAPADGAEEPAPEDEPAPEEDTAPEEGAEETTD